MNFAELKEAIMPKQTSAELKGVEVGISGEVFCSVVWVGLFQKEQFDSAWCVCVQSALHTSQVNPAKILCSAVE